MIFQVLISLLLWLLAGCDRPPAEPSSPAPAGPAPATAPATGPATGTAPRPDPTTGTATAPRPPAPAANLDQLPQARELATAGKLVEARDLLRPLAEDAAAPAEVLDLLGDLNTRIILTPVKAPEKLEYTIVAGDSLGKIAKAQRTTVDLLKQSNNLKSDTIRAGDRLRIYQAEFAVAVNKTANTLTLTDHGKFFKRYRVGTGEYSKTPEGTFQVITRIKDPPWWRGDKEIPFGDPANILGTHWLGLDTPGYGLHGTWDTNSIGHQATAGCVRLLNGDIAELYTLLPVGTPVTIQE